MAERRERCPKCNRGDRDRAFSRNTMTGLFFCHRCGYCGGEGTTWRRRAPTVTQLGDPQHAARTTERYRRLLEETRPISDARGAYPVRRYLESRGLSQILKEATAPDVRAHPSLAYWDGTQELGRFPAMVVPLRSLQGELVTLHVTYLRGDGGAKADVPEPKKIRPVPTKGATRGCALRLYEPRGGALGVAEGIETALSLRLLHGIPTWAASCADNLKIIELPIDLSQLYIAVDCDHSGESAVAALARRLLLRNPGLEIFLVRPEGRVGDLNDELRRKVLG
jgi:putative DNA primase/helicase